jgi:hypothetical protein
VRGVAAVAGGSGDLPTRAAASVCSAAMRSLALICLVAAGCGDTGLALAISAPDVPPGVDRIEIVLASPDFVVGEDQLTGGDVRYYRQQATAGELAKPGKLDGYVVRLEGRDGQGDETFVPFVIAYAGAEPVAAGSVLDGDGLPIPLAVPSASRIEATISMVALLPADPDLGVMSGQIEEVRCSSNTGEWRSGIAWQPPADVQLRLLLPEPGGDSKQDATARPLDLDCDGVRVNAGDCDDLRARIHTGAAEKCDGEDSNCDGAHYAVTQCDPPTGECEPSSVDGIQVCHDADAAPRSTCQGSPACRCRLGSGGACAKCTLAIEGMAPPVKPCAPAAARLPLPQCTQSSPCDVEVMQYPDNVGWDIAIASGASLEFKSFAKVINTELALRVKPRALPTTAAPGASVGAVHLVVRNDMNDVNVFTVIDIDLQLGPGRIEGCSSIPTQNGTYPMACQL